MGGMIIFEQKWIKCQIWLTKLVTCSSWFWFLHYRKLAACLAQFHWFSLPEATDLIDMHGKKTSFQVKDMYLEEMKMHISNFQKKLSDETDEKRSGQHTKDYQSFVSVLLCIRACFIAYVYANIDNIWCSNVVLHSMPECLQKLSQLFTHSMNLGSQQ